MFRLTRAIDFFTTQSPEVSESVVASDSLFELEQLLVHLGGVGYGERSIILKKARDLHEELLIEYNLLDDILFEKVEEYEKLHSVSLNEDEEIRNVDVKLYDRLEELDREYASTIGEWEKLFKRVGIRRQNFRTLYVYDSELSRRETRKLLRSAYDSLNDGNDLPEGVILLPLHGSLYRSSYEDLEESLRILLDRNVGYELASDNYNHLVERKDYEYVERDIHRNTFFHNCILWSF